MKQHFLCVRHCDRYSVLFNSRSLHFTDEETGSEKLRSFSPGNGDKRQSHSETRVGVMPKLGTLRGILARCPKP